MHENKPRYDLIRLSEDPSGKERLVEFLGRLNTGQTAFRYFQSRPVEIIDRHEVTLLLVNNSISIAYGHLEEDGDRLWLGIAVADDAVGQGWGKLMMQELLAEAESSLHEMISLRVDIGNEAGVGLYEKLGFKIVDEPGQSSSYLMERPIVDSNA